MFVTLKMFLHALLPPPASPLLLAVAGLLLIWGKRRRLGATLLAVAWLACGCARCGGFKRSVAIGGALPGSRSESTHACPGHRHSRGGGYRYAAPEYGGPAPELALLDRLTYGAFVARRTSLPVLVSGNATKLAPCAHP